MLKSEKHGVTVRIALAGLFQRFQRIKVFTVSMSAPFATAEKAKEYADFQFRRFSACGKAVIAA